MSNLPRPGRGDAQSGGGACRISKDDDGMFTVHYESKEGASTVRAGKVMFGTGRKPNTKGIGLEVGGHLAAAPHSHHVL